MQIDPLIHVRPSRPTNTLAAETHRKAQYVAEQAFAAMRRGIPIEGICLYPIQDYPGWFDERHSPTGLVGMPDSQGRRILHSSLQTELRTQQAMLTRLLEDSSASHFLS